MTRVLRIDEINTTVVEKLYLYAHITDRMMAEHLSVVESSFPRVVTDDF